MNKSELVGRVASAAALEKRQAEAAVDAVIDAVMADTRAGNTAALFGFGSFVPNSRAARVGCTSQTGAPVKIAASKSVKFSPAVCIQHRAQFEARGCGEDTGEEVGQVGQVTKKR